MAVSPADFYKARAENDLTPLAIHLKEARYAWQERSRKGRCFNSNTMIAYNAVGASGVNER
jgi:hypothetical protein